MKPVSSLFFLIILLNTLPVFAQFRLEPAPWESGQSRAEDLLIQYVSFSPGDDITTYWGHAGVIVADTVRKVSRLYNFGLFSLGDGMLARFAMGRLIFSSGQSRVANYFEWYRSSNRDVHIQTLNFTPAQRLALAHDLAEAVKPENRDYLYHHYYENCATRIRDMIDRQTDGAVAEWCADRASTETYRELTRRYLTQSAWLDILLLFVMNKQIDRPITDWERMFLPDGLTEVFRHVPLSGRMLVAEEGYYFKSDRPALPEKPVARWPILLTAGLIIGLSALVLGSWQARSTHLAPRFLLGLLNGFYGLIVGLAGLLLFLMASFTEHDVTFYNENMLLANPLTFLLFLLSFALIAGRWQALRQVYFIWAIQLVFLLVLLLMKLFPVFYQYNYPLLAFFIPVTIGFFLAHHRLNRSAGFASSMPQAKG